MEKFKLPNLDNEKSILKTIRLKLSTFRELEKLSVKTNLSINRIINECILYSLKNISLNEFERKKEE